MTEEELAKLRLDFMFNKRVTALLAHVDALRRERDELQERLHGVIDGNKHGAISARIAIHRLLDGAEVEQHADYHVRIAALIADRDKTVAELRSALAHVDALGREKGELADLVKYMTPTEAMVERAAVAMYDHDEGRVRNWNACHEETRYHYRSLARRALTAALGGDREA